MAFSLSNWFKGKPGAPGSEQPGEQAQTEPSASPAAVATPPAAAPASTPTAVRKVVPNSVQPVSLRSHSAPRPVALPVSMPTSPADRAAAMNAQTQRPRISFGDAPMGSFAGGDSGAAPVEPPAALADATVTLEIGDFYDRLPPGLLQSGAPVDRRRAVEFRASELYSDLTKGRASVPASVIYQKCPELFSRPVTETEDTEISLPLQKLVEQMSQAFQTRTDQLAEENVGEIETPFLQVAMEDNARLPKAAGTSTGAIRAPGMSTTASPLNEPPRRPHRTGQIQTISPLKPAPEPPPMQSAPSAPINPALKRPPSTVRASVAGGKIRLSGPTMPNRMAVVSPANAQPSAPVSPVLPAVAAEASATTPVTPVELPPSASQRILPPLQVPGAPTASPSHQVSKKTARIQIPPISLKSPGAGSRPAAPSAVSVQASPVPVRPSPSAEPAVPPIAFRSSPPPPSTKKMPHTFAPPPPRPLVPPAFPASPTPSPAMPAFPAATDDRKISLSLAAVLRGLPTSALTLEPNSVPDDVRFTLPFSLVESQLAQGRVSVPVAVFSGSLPESHREVLASNSGLSEIPLPLQEVFQNLPPAALSIRQDQVTEEISHVYPTPFAQKAEEDAERLGNIVKDSAPAPAAAPAPEISVDRPLPPDPVAESPAAPEAKAAPAPEPVAEKPAEDAPSEEFANLFVEEPPVPTRDIPLDFDADKPADQSEAAPVEAKAHAEEKPEHTPAPEPAEEKQPEPVAEAKPEPVVEAKTELSPEPEHKPEAHAEDQPAQSAASPAPATEEKAEPAAEEKREEPAAFKPVEEPARAEEPVKPEPEPVKAEEARPEPAPAAASNGQHAVPAEDKPTAPVRQVSLLPVHDNALQGLFMTEDELDAKSIVRHVCALPGIEGCAVMFEDGLQLAGNFPSEADAEGFSAMAPPFFKRTRNFAGETHLGALRAFTLYTETGMFSFFMHEHICLSVRHAGRGFLPGVREKLETVTRELARMYATDVQAH